VARTRETARGPSRVRLTPREPAASPFWELSEARQQEFGAAEEEVAEEETAKPPRPRPVRRLSAPEQKHYRGRLLQLRDAIVKNLEELREELRGLQEPSPELEEWAQEEKERDILILQEQRQEEELTRIQVALQRLEEGTYGHCARCGRKIAKERLEEVPTAVFCRYCQP
jgi:DnaK suppressor protein